MGITICILDIRCRQVVGYPYQFYTRMSCFMLDLRVELSSLHMLQCQHLIPGTKCVGQRVDNTRPLAGLPPFLGMDATTCP